jgi:hypothetical protein
VLKKAVIIACLLLVALGLSGCLEQSQSPHDPSGSLNNFFLHLYDGELNDAEAYFAPGLVTPSPQLDDSVRTASEQLRRYEIQRAKFDTQDLSNGEKQVTLRGKVRPRPSAGQPTPTSDSGWQETDIITAHMVERGPGWRILDFQLKCCDK